MATAKFIEIKNNNIYLSVPYDDKDELKKINGYQWHGSTKLWSIPMDARFRLYDLFHVEQQEIESAVNEYLTSLKQIKAQKEIVIKEKTLDYAFKRKPFAHQKYMMKKAIVEKQFAFFTEMGTGKTQALINVFDYLRGIGSIKKVLVVCPKTIMGNWGEEITNNCEMTWAIVDGSRAQREKILSGESQVVIINYEALRTFSKWKGWPSYDCIILDESSKVKNPGAQITKIILSLFKNIDFKYIASGTPLQTPLDVYTQMKFLNEDFLGFKSFYSFRNYYAVMGGFGGYEILSYRNTEELKRRLDAHSVQLKKEDCVDLPEKIYTKRILQLSGEVAEQYREFQKKSVVFTESAMLTADIVLTELLRLQEITSGGYLSDQKANMKLIELKDLIDDNIKQQQIVVWCRFRKSISLIENLLTSMQIPFHSLHGDVPGADRKGIIDDFQSGKVKVLVGQIQTGGMGITLTRGSLVIYYENTFSLAERKQSEDRCHRIGQKVNVTYVDIVYDRTIDTKILKAIMEKQDVATYLVQSFKKGDYNVNNR